MKVSFILIISLLNLLYCPNSSKRSNICGNWYGYAGAVVLQIKDNNNYVIKNIFGQSEKGKWKIRDNNLIFINSKSSSERKSNSLIKKRTKDSLILDIGKQHREYTILNLSRNSNIETTHHFKLDSIFIFLTKGYTNIIAKKGIEIKTKFLPDNLYFTKSDTIKCKWSIKKFNENIFIILYDKIGSMSIARVKSFSQNIVTVEMYSLLDNRTTILIYEKEKK